MYKYVLPGSLNAHPCDGDRHDRTGPTIEKVPIVYSKIPVTNPLRLLISFPCFALSLAFKRSIRPERLSFVPITAPIAKLRINMTGYSLLAILGKDAFTPSTRHASPSALNIADLYFSPIPSRTIAPKAPPTSIVLVFTIVPNIFIF